jgi:GNAT superfamily N-acetyltransferase
MRRAKMPKRSVIAFSSESEASPDKAAAQHAKKRLRSDCTEEEVAHRQPGSTLSKIFAKDSEGQAYSIEERATNNTGGVQFIIKRGSVALFGNYGTFDRASFSCSTQFCEGKSVKLDRFQLPVALRRQGHGTWALRLIMELYRKHGCACIEVPSPTHQGKGLYRKCGFTDEHRIGLRYNFKQKGLPKTPTTASGSNRRGRLPRSLYGGIKQQVHVQLPPCTVDMYLHFEFYTGKNEKTSGGARPDATKQGYTPAQRVLNRS